MLTIAESIQSIRLVFQGLIKCKTCLVRKWPALWISSLISRHKLFSFGRVAFISKSHHSYLLERLIIFITLIYPGIVYWAELICWTVAARCLPLSSTRHRRATGSRLMTSVIRCSQFILLSLQTVRTRRSPKFPTDSHLYFRYWDTDHFIERQFPALQVQSVSFSGCRQLFFS